MRRHVGNAVAGVLDYAAYPVGMLAVAPIVLRHAGAAEYGVWAMATAVVSVGGIIAAGFGDANIQFVATARGEKKHEAIEDAVRAMIGINLALGLAMAAIAWVAAPLAVAHVAADPALQHACLVSLRIAAAMVLVRALESVCVSTQRAFERYAAAIRISVAARLASLVAAGVLAVRGHGTEAIMIATAVLLTAGTAWQFVRLRKELGVRSFMPAFPRAVLRALLAFGIFSWLQAVVGVVFSQVDRLFLGVSLGAVTLASYALCAQLAQPLFGLTAAALHFLFPHLAARAQHEDASTLRNTLLRALAVNVGLVAGGSALLLIFGRVFLARWAGAEIAASASSLLPALIAGSALLGLSVTGAYALLAFGRVRAATWISVAGGVLMLVAMKPLLARFGAEGIALARVLYGVFSLLVYVPLLRDAHLRITRNGAPALNKLRAGESV